MEQAENPSSSRGYYCHNCNNTISLPITNFLCPDCHQGFIEKLPDGPASSSSFNDRNGENRDDMDSDPVVVLNRVFDDISNNLDVIMGGGESNARNSDNRASSSNRRDATTHPSRPNDRRRGRNQPAGTFEQVLSGLLSNMSRNAQTFDGNGPVLLVGNPGDYAWGHEGLDTIVTQLLNQMDSSGPPPLAQDKIKELPFVSITAQQVSENIQCSVCWDSFKMTEKVRQLPCDHIYHDLCIVPWLELHGTCPICRKLLSEDNEGRLGFPHTGGLEALLSDVHGFSILQRSYAPSTTNRRSQIRCYRCHNRGHYARECDQRSMSANTSRRGPFQNVTGARDYPSHRHSASQRSFLGAGATESTNQRRSSTRDSRRGASSTRSYSNHRHSPSRAVPMHEFLEEFDVEGDFLTDSDDFYGSDLDDLSDVVPCEVCGLTRDDHHDFPGSSPDTWLPYDFGDRATVSSGWGSPMSANFAGFGATSGQTDQQPRVNNGRKRKTLTCYNCKKPGHMARDCWYNNKCSHCSKNHKSSDCWHAPNRTVPSSGFRTGTDVRSSPRNFNPETNRFNRYSDGSGPSTSRFREPNSHDRHQCFHCREFGHIARNCPAAPKRNTNAGRVRLCHSCGREGHFSRECPVNF